MAYSSQIVENVVTQLAQLPGVGKKTALRFALFLIKQNKPEFQTLINSLQALRDDLHFCSLCHNVSDTTICHICLDETRNHDTLCIVESIRDVIAIEQLEQYKGVYYVLGGLISPLDGVGPDHLKIPQLIDKLHQHTYAEIIFALNPTIQGDTTIFYIRKYLNNFPHLKITSLSRGVAFGGELEYADELTLARALHNRMPIDAYVKA